MFFLKKLHIGIIGLVLLGVILWSLPLEQFPNPTIHKTFKINNFSTDSILPIRIKKDVRIKNYFQFIDSLVTRYDTLTSYRLTEHLLVRANPWIIDTLQNTDYYRMKAKDSLVYDQKEMIVFKAGSILEVPAFAKAEKIISLLEKTYIDINIPEYALRIYEDSLLQHQFTVRVGEMRKNILRWGIE